MLVPRTSDGIAVESFDVVRKAFESAPLNAAPAGLRPAVWRVWTVTAHLFPNPLPLAAAVGLWVRDHGLREDDAAAILTGFCSPTRMGQFRFASDLMTALANAAAEAIRRRKVQAEAQDRERGDRLPDRATMNAFHDWYGKFSSHFGAEDGSDPYPRAEDVL